MFGNRIILKRGARDEAEKPFWISYADLMTALMVLFLVVMSVALLAVTKRVSEADRLKMERDQAIQKLLDEVQQAAREYPGVRVDRNRNVINFGDKATFPKDSYALTPEQEVLLRSFVPKVLDIAENPLGRKWLKQIVVEGFSSPEGTYLYNLNLSLERSQRVLCALLAPVNGAQHPLTDAERHQVRDLFLVGGYSYNAAKSSYQESRRIELRLEFLGVGETRPAPAAMNNNDIGGCALKG